MRTLEGKVAIVTGASMGIGAAIAEELTREGARVALVARGRGALEAQAAKIGALARSYPCDMSDPAAIEDMVADVESDLGPVAILVNNVGAGTFKPLPPRSTPATSSATTPTWGGIPGCRPGSPCSNRRRWRVARFRRSGRTIAR
ncbi:SDR family NAD(P)-dependent oxidoreductase [Nocardioides limicola]|uniref:SDR family NAD(P)-dependent oxidoreductase n=1 Tax=Nocardioides limicola TaxID=2803368 RepID=UPI00193B4F3A